MQRQTNFRAPCSLLRKWRQSSLLPAPPRPAWYTGFTHQSSSVSASRPSYYSTPLCSRAPSESSLAHDLSLQPSILLGVGLGGASLLCLFSRSVGVELTFILFSALQKHHAWYIRSKICPFKREKSPNPPCHLKVVLVTTRGGLV